MQQARTHTPPTLHFPTDVSSDSVIWSHLHWDHTGNVSLFPPSTSLVVGPGFKDSPKYLPGFPTKADSPVSASDFSHRTLTEISSFPLTIGELPAHDFFGDGSFYLLDTPGHCLGHVCGLARTTPSTATSPSTFVLMGGDICHFAGDFRPNRTHPLPDPIPSSHLDRTFPSPCPAHLFTSTHPLSPSSPRTTPWYNVSTSAKSAYESPSTAARSVRRMQTHFDESEHVLVCIAHDPTLLHVLPTLNTAPDRDLNAWKSRGWKEQCHWGWLNELPRDGAPGRERIVDGFWREGRRWDRREANERMEDEGQSRMEKAKEEG